MSDHTADNAVQRQAFFDGDATRSLLEEHLVTFLAQAQAQSGTALPQFVKDELDGFLQCGVPRLRGGGAYWPTGFCGCAAPSVPMRSWWRSRASGAELRIKCGPSCGARRMAETAAPIVQ